MLVLSKLLSNKENIKRIFPVILIAIALPLVVLLSLQQQNVRQKAASVNCNDGLTCGTCTANSPTCSYGNGTQTCTYTKSLDGSSCNPVSIPNVFCHVNNCALGSICNSSQVCVTQATPTPTVTPVPTVVPTTGIYGMGIAADSLNNIQLGGPNGNPGRLISYRFRAEQSAALTGARFYIVDGTGYSGGNGGSFNATIQTDDGTSNHFPSGKVLATSQTLTPGNPINIGFFPVFTFTPVPTLVAGQLYHLVFRNTGSNPAVNFISPDELYVFGNQLVPNQPRFADTDLRALVNDGSGWSYVDNNMTPILDISYSNGAHQGMGYMEIWVNAPKTISGTSEVREQFTPTTNHTVSSATVRLKKLSGSSSLTVRLETSNGTLITQGQISSASIGTTAVWVKANFPSSVTLTAGTNYHLVLTSPSDTSYSTWGIERGNNYSFSPVTYFSDGYGQYTTNGTSWSGFDQPGGSSNNTNADMQFYFQ